MLNENLNNSIQQIKEQLYNIIYPTINSVVDDNMSDEQYECYEDIMDIVNEIDKDFVELEFYLKKMPTLNDENE